MQNRLLDIAATVLVRSMGQEAPGHAALQADIAKEAGDKLGAKAWLAVAYRCGDVLTTLAESHHRDLAA